MGICQTVCGAATSGKGISGFTLANVLKHAGTRGCPDPIVGPITRAHCLETLRDEIRCDNERVAIELLAPRVFQRIRDLENITPDHFSSQWDIPREKCGLADGGGRSMAMFLASLTGTFLMKTIAAVEAEVLLKTLPRYVAHLEKTNDSFLMRYVMLLKIQTEGGEVGYVVVFVNVFDEGKGLVEKWDLKGRYPKPSKYEEAVQEYQGGTSTVKVPVRKDKHLQRAFYIKYGIRDIIVQTLNADFQFLESENLMDYSILIGVQNLKEEVSSTDPSLPAPSPSLVYTPSFAQNTLRKALSKYHGGIPSLDHSELLIIGVIDALTFYNGKKKSANFFKTVLWTEETLSTVPPKVYKKRISEFTNIIFPEARPEWRHIENIVLGGQPTAGL